MIKKMLLIKNYKNDCLQVKIPFLQTTHEQIQNKTK
jgi:hypothetical protein